jgi:hypothetical protein
MMGLLARPAMETRNRRAEGANPRAAERRDAGGSSAAGRGAASLDTVPVIAAGVGWWEPQGGMGGVGLVAHGGLLRGFGAERSRRGPLLLVSINLSRRILLFSPTAFAPGPLVVLRIHFFSTFTYYPFFQTRKINMMPIFFLETCTFFT